MARYLMHLDLFDSLCSVTGFNNLNGNSYNEHACIILQIDGKLKEQIMSCETYDSIMKLLKENNYNLTHDVNFFNEQKI
mgnify:FL=1